MTFQFNFAEVFMLSPGSKKNYLLPRKSEPKSSKRMIMVLACLAKSKQQQKINLASIPDRNTWKRY